MHESCAKAALLVLRIDVLRSDIDWGWSGAEETLAGWQAAPGGEEGFDAIPKLPVESKL